MKTTYYDDLPDKYLHYHFYEQLKQAYPVQVETIQLVDQLGRITLVNAGPLKEIFRQNIG